MSILDNIKGLRPLNPAERERLDAFKKQMREVVVPRIVKAVHDRQQRAADARRRGIILR